jgi:signal peptidase I
MNLRDVITNESHALKCEMAAEVLQSSGTLRLRVTGWSMLPTVWPGDTLVVERLDSAELAEGDIVLFGRDRRLFAHRVVKKENSVLVTRGDSMPTVDSPVGQSEFLGRVSSIVRNGRHIEPRRTLRVEERAIASLVQRSEIAARVVVGVRGLLDTSDQTVK